MLSLETPVCHVFFYADDVVILAENENDLQAQLDTVNEWCRNWRLELNQTKTEIIHFRNVNVTKCIKQFKIGNLDIDYCIML